MRRARTQILAIFLAATFSASAAEWAADVALHLDESTVLPGTPTGLTLTVSNGSGRELELPSLVWLIASTAEGKSFPLRTSLSGEGKPLPVPEEVRRIAPGGTHEIRFDVPHVVQGAPWLLDERIAAPGEYRLRAVFAKTVDAAGLYDVGSALASSEVVYTVEQPAGEDEKVWRWMVEKAGGPWGERAWFRQPGELAEFVLTRHPSSRYALYAAIWAPWKDLDRQEAILRRVIDENPEIAFADQLELELARRHHRAFLRAYQLGDLDGAERARLSTAAITSRLATKGRSSAVRKEACQINDALPTHEEMVRRVVSREPS